MAELLSLSWNNHRTTFCHTLSSLKEKELFSDATLACDGVFYPVHKFVLSVCSEYFDSILQRTPCKHPVIVLKDVQISDMQALLSYMYDGAVSVPQRDLARLIKTAEMLRIKGLAVPDDVPVPTSSPPPDNKDSPSPTAKRKRREERRKDRDRDIKRQERDTSVQLDIEEILTPIKEEVVEENEENCRVEEEASREDVDNFSSDYPADTKDNILANSNNEDIGDDPSIIDPLQDLKGQEGDFLSPEMWVGDTFSSGDDYSNIDYSSDPLNMPSHSSMGVDGSVDQRIHPTEGYKGVARDFKQHKCPICDYSSYYTTTLKRHILTHTGERPFKCSLCDFSSARNCGLRMHMFRNHQNIDLET